jgi:hypothetical protein
MSRIKKRIVMNEYAPKMENILHLNSYTDEARRDLLYYLFSDRGVLTHA